MTFFEKTRYYKHRVKQTKANLKRSFLKYFSSRIPNDDQLSIDISQLLANPREVISSRIGSDVEDVDFISIFTNDSFGDDDNLDSCINLTQSHSFHSTPATIATSMTNRSSTGALSSKSSQRFSPSRKSLYTFESNHDISASSIWKSQTFMDPGVLSNLSCSNIMKSATTLADSISFEKRLGEGISGSYTSLGTFMSELTTSKIQYPRDFALCDQLQEYSPIFTPRYPYDNFVDSIKVEKYEYPNDVKSKGQYRPKIFTYKVKSLPTTEPMIDISPLLYLNRSRITLENDFYF